MPFDPFEKPRARLLTEIERNARETENFTGRARFSDAVMAALADVPRHRFLPAENGASAYVNRPQAIGYGQTISQPYIVALMTDLLVLGPTDRVLEIGTGCGYQAAVLAEVAGEVFSVERVKDLATGARSRLRDLGYENIHILEGDGFQGWPEKAPFEAIIVTAAPEQIPQALCDQLKVGGRMVVPVGPPHATQFLKVGVKEENGTVAFRSTLPVAFVPMVKNPA